MSTDLYVPMKLDKPRKFKLTIDDMQEVYDALNAQPNRKTEINGWTIHAALGAWDWKAWDMVMWAGLRHSDAALAALDATSGPDEVHGIIRRFVERDGSDALEPIGAAMRYAMMLSGALPRKVWEKTDGRKHRRDAEAKTEAEAKASGGAGAQEETDPRGALETTT